MNRDDALEMFVQLVERRRKLLDAYDFARTWKMQGAINELGTEMNLNRDTIQRIAQSFEPTPPEKEEKV